METTEITKTENGLSTTPVNLLQLAIEKNAPIESLEKLMALQEQWEKRQARKAYYESLANFQRDCPVITKNRKADFPTKSGGRMSYKYASLDEIIKDIKDPLSKHGLTYRFEFGEVGNQHLVTCVITHIAGHSESTPMKGGADNSGMKNDLQQIGSTLTYLQRYTLIGALGITTAQSDDDGNRSQKINPALTPQSKNWKVTVQKLAAETVSLKVVEEHFSLTAEHREQLQREALELQK